MKRQKFDTVTKTLKILEELAKYPDGLGVTELSKITGLYKSTTFRILSTLLENSFLEKNPQNEKYSLSTKIFEIGRKSLASKRISKIAGSVLEELSRETMENVALVMVDAIRNTLTVIDEVLSPQSIGATSLLGKSFELSENPVTLAFLSGLSNDEIMSLMEHRKKSSLTEDFILEKYKDKIYYVRETGYYIFETSDNESHKNEKISSVSAPIYNEKNQIISILLLWGPKFRIDEEKLILFCKLVREKAKQISLKLGYVFY